MERTGIGDAELARRIQVNRRTLVRWKEGVTASPRYREDVVRCAEVLRLTEEEADSLLLAAGFGPERVSSESEPSDVAGSEGAAEVTPVQPTPAAGEPTVASEGHPTTPRRGRTAVLSTGVVVLFPVMLAVALVMALRVEGIGEYPTAAGNELLIVLAPFANYTAGGQGFNVQGRLKSAIDSEVGVAGLANVRIVDWPVPITREGDATAARDRSDAWMVIWGEYDSGRIVARFSVSGDGGRQQDEKVVSIATSPADLMTTINVEFADEVSTVAITILGQLLLEREEFDRAKRVLIRANSMRPSSPAALARIRYLLGHAYLGGQFADFDEAIWLFTQVLAVHPRAADAYSSRALAYLDRGRPGDAELAVKDMKSAVDIRPDDPRNHLNLAVAYIETGSDTDFGRALDHLNRALALSPDYAAAHVNRADVFVRRGMAGDLGSALAEVEKALALEHDLASAYLVRGNGYVSLGEAGDMPLAIADFSRAIELAPEWAAAYFNRGLVYSDLEDLDAALDDLRRAQELSPHDPLYNRTLCWQLAVSGDAAGAEEYCEMAVARDPRGLARDSMGLVNALNGRSEQAVADFRTFLEWVGARQTPACGEQYLASRTAWIEMLKVGDDPFDPATLRELRVRPTLPGKLPC